MAPPIKISSWQLKGRAIALQRLVSILTVLTFATSQAASAQPSAAESSRPLIQAIRAYLVKQVEPDTPVTPAGRFWIADIPGTELIIVYPEERYFCGSGGCVMQILRRSGHLFQDIGSNQVVFPPITLLSMRHHGLPDLGIICRNGGEWQCAAKFNGKRYEVDWDLHVQADIAHPKGRLLLTDADEGYPMLTHAAPLKPGFTCVRKRPGQGYPTDMPFGIRPPVCPESMFKNKSASSR